MFSSTLLLFSESTIIADQSTVLADRTLIGPDDCDSRQPVQTVTRFYCQDCEPNTESMCLISSSSSCTRAPGASSPGGSEISTIYSRVRKHKPHRGEMEISNTKIV